MGNGMNKVLPGLYLGSFRDGKDSEQLQVNQITHIVSIHDTAKVVVEDREYLCIRVPDSPDENLTKYFSRCNDFIHSARMGGGNVLIHCLAGVSRSATIATAYIMSVTSLNCKDALKVIRGARNIANPNYGFHSQLKEFESYTLTSERKRLKIRYSAFDNQKSDEEECAKMITVYHSNLPSSSNSTPTHMPSASASSMVTSSPKRRPSVYSFSSRPSTPTHKPSTSCSSSPSSPTHKLSASNFSSNPSSPTHKPSTSFFSKPSSPTHKPSTSFFSKPSSPTYKPLSSVNSSHSAPQLSPLHRLYWKQRRSASSSPKRSTK